MDTNAAFALFLFVLLYHMALGVGGYVFFFSANKILESRGSGFRVKIKWVVLAYALVLFYHAATFCRSESDAVAAIVLAFFLFLLSFLVGFGVCFSIAKRLR